AGLRPGKQQGRAAEAPDRAASMAQGSAPQEPDTAAPGGDAGPPTPAPEAPERPVLTLPPARLIGSLALSVGMMLITLVFIGVIVAVIVTGSAEPIFAIGAPIIGAGAYWWGRFS